MSDQATKSPHQEAARGVEESLTRMLGGTVPAEKPEAAQQQAGELPEETGIEQQTASDEAPGTEGEGQEPADAASEDIAEVEIDGEIYQVPRKISDKFIQHADYTKKTQDLAELRRDVMANQETLRLSQAFDQATTQERQTLNIVEAQLQQFAAVDWGQMGTEDLLRTRAQYDRLKDQRAELEKAITAKRGDFQKQVEVAQRQQLEAGARYIAQHIKGWNDKTQKSLMEYGVSQGYMAEELGRITDPRVVVTLHKAMKWDELQSSAPGIQNRARQAAPVVKPGASIKQPSQKEILAQRVKKAAPGKAKHSAIEDALASSRFFGGR